MKWDIKNYDIELFNKIDNYEEKGKIAKKVASFVNDGDVIGFGSGSTSYLAVKEIAKRVKEENLKITAIPTSLEIRMVSISLGIPVATINDLKPNWGFDGADEVDNNGNLIKGRGGAMFNEKLIMANSPKTYILVDKSKLVDKLGKKFPIPVECVPDGVNSVTNKLLELGASNVTIRLSGTSKDGPVITENGNFILDAKFDDIDEVLEDAIKNIVGVLESGLFTKYNIEIIN